MSAAEIASLCVAAATLISALAGLVVAIRTGTKVDATHTLVNGQSGALNALTGKAAYAEGMLAGAGVPDASVAATNAGEKPPEQHSGANQRGPQQ